MKIPSVPAVCRRLDALMKLWRDTHPQPAELLKVAAQLDAPEDGTQKEWTRLTRKSVALATQLADWEQFQARLEHAGERHGLLGVTQLVTALCCCAALCLNVVEMAAAGLDPAEVWGAAQLLSSIAGPCATAVRHLDSGPGGEAWRSETSHQMMRAARVALRLAAERCGLSLGAYVADSVQHLVGFLDLTSSILLAEGALEDSDEEASMSHHCTGLMFELLAQPAVCTAVAASTDSGGALRHTLVQLLVQRCLPFAAALLHEAEHGRSARSGTCTCAECRSHLAAAAGELAPAEWVHFCSALHLATGPVLQGGLQQHLRSSSGTAGGQERLRLVQQAAGMVSLLPRKCPAGMDAAELPALHSNAIQLLGTLCSCLPLPRRLRQEAAQQPGSTAPPTPAQQAALAALAAVPAMCALLHKALSREPAEGGTDAGDMPVTAPGLERMCQAASSVLAVGPSLPTAVLSAEQTRLLLAAGTASLRLLPQLLQLQQAGQSDGVAVAARLLAARCLATAQAAAEAAVSQAGLDATMSGTDGGRLARTHAAHDAAWQALLPELQELSVAACRAVHWHAAEGGADLVPASLWVRMPRLLQDLSTPVLTAAQLPQPGNRHIQGLEAGHAAALLALAPAFAPGAPCTAATAEPGPMQWNAGEQYGIALADAYHRSPLALRPALLEALASVVATQREQGGGKLTLVFAESLLGPASRCAPLAAELVWNGVLPVLLEPAPTGRALMMYGPDGGVQQVTVLAVSVAMSAGKMLQAVVAEAHRLAADGVLAGDEATGSTVRAVELLLGRALRLDTPEQLSQFKHIASQPALAQLGAAVAAAHRQRAEDAAAEDALALARAAATRSCAYLRCANLAGSGGARAGQGKGSMKCSACRTAWYCGTGCSHADWREGGHRRTCKQLAAERTAHKAARQA